MRAKAEQKQKEYFVSHLGQHVGPWSIEDVALRLSNRELLATDFIYDEASADWIELSRHEGLLAIIAAEFRPKAAPPIKAAMNSTERPTQRQAPIPTPVQTTIEAPSVNESWFIQKTTHRFGPLSSAGVIKALQEKSIHDFELIWKEGMQDWVRIAEHPEFSSDKVRELISTPDSKNLFIEREFPRITLMNEVMVHDDNSLWMGQTFQGGEGGSGIIIQNAALKPGQVVRLHFASHDGLKAFNATGEIVSKKFVKEIKNKKTPVPYGLKFVGLDKKLQNTLHDYFTYKTQPGWMFAGK